MTIRFSPAEPARLTDTNLMTHLRDLIAEAQRRRTVKPELRQLLAEVLSEEKAEMLAGAGLDPEEIARLSAIDPQRLMGPIPAEAL